MSNNSFSSRRELIAHAAMLGVGSQLSMPAIAQARPKVRVVSINILSFSPLFIARELGFYDKEGIDVEIVETNSGNQITSSLLGGSADVVASGFANPSILANQGKTVKHMCGSVMAAEYAILVRPNIDVPTDDLKALIAALKGKRIGVNSLGTGADNFISGMLVEAGVGVDWALRVAVGAGGSALAAMKAGSIDAIMSYEPDLTQIAKSGLGKVALDLRNTKSGTAFARVPSTTIQATSEWIKNNRGTSIAFVKSIVSAVNTLRNDPETSVNVLSKLYPSMEINVIRAMYEGMRPVFGSAISAEVFDIAAQVYLKQGTVKRAVSYEEVVATEFAPLWI